jgi:hypothetical protein
VETHVKKNPCAIILELEQYLQKHSHGGATNSLEADDEPLKFTKFSE